VEVWSVFTLTGMHPLSTWPCTVLYSECSVWALTPYGHQSSTTRA